jgi:hypothetical protein
MFLKTISLSVLTLSLAGCGPMPSGGQDGVDGRSPKCSVEDRLEGKRVLRCVNPDGTSSEVELPDLGSQTPSFASLASCFFESDAEEARFNVLAFGETHKISSLSVKNKKTSQVFFQSALVHALGEPSFSSAETKISAWSAKLVGDKAAELSKITQEKWSMTCI